MRARGRPADTVSRCADLVAQLLPTRGCDLAAVAAALELHPRTLQRRLRAAGADFRSVLERERRTFALRYLADPELPLVRIAGRLGYADQPTFTRACAGWFGVTPAVMRERLLAGELPDVRG
ncbi:MAG: helix-turn-helix domain-containing protein [Pseudomonadales bacterium]|nr:helix-turn-helix domain-containing protein [Pseudomonadales bacterium]